MDNKQQQATPMLHPLTPAVSIGFATHVSITPPAARGRRSTPPLATALAHGEMNRQRAGYRTEHCKDSQEARVFGTAFYHNTLRREVANEQLRTALGCVTASPLCRHDIKRIVKRMQCRLSQWDVALAHSIKRSDLVDVYDGLVERALDRYRPLVQTLYHCVLQLFTRHGCRQSPLLAHVQVAEILVLYANRRLVRDIEATRELCPTTELLRCDIDEQQHRMCWQLLDALDRQLVPKGVVISPAKDKMVNLAADNLIKALDSHQQLREVEDAYFASLEADGAPNYSDINPDPEWNRPRG
ncbi:hypothetical protein [Prevotellamassilia timonensis]|uniref:hypothetical protein n=1 Tax=Prevotellamassilia timonensis TaxID=1852370 RepID=UPI00307BAFCF